MTITKEGALASFYTVNKAPIKHLRVYFSPKQAGEGDPSPENVREIEGYSRIILNSTKKNLIDLLKASSSSQNWAYGRQIANAPPNGDLILETGTYTFSVSDNRMTGLYITDETGTSIINAYNKPSITFTVPKKQAIGIYLYKENAPSGYWNTLTYQLELGSTATEYEPYRGHTYNLDWSNDIGTIYGGYVDLVTGELVQEYNLAVAKKSDFGGQVISTNNNNVYRQTSNLFPQAHSGTNWNLARAEQLFNYGKISNPWSENTYGNYTGLIIYQNTTMGCYMRISEAIYEALGENDEITISYKLETPITRQLTPTQLQTLIGQNNIWSNADRVEVEYDLAESNDELYRRRNLLLRSYPSIKTASNSFTTDLSAPLKSAKIYFNPIQEGTGDPSPTNIRPITGWTGLSLYHSGDNLYVPNAENRGYINASGTIVVDDNNTYTDLIPVIAGQTYSFKCTTAYVNGSTNRRVHGYNSSGNWVQQIIVGTTAEKTVEDKTILIQVPSGISYIRVSFKKEDLNVSVRKENIYNVDWSNDVGTVYGGYVDLVKGELVAECIEKTALWGDAKIGSPSETTGYQYSYLYSDDSLLLPGNGAIYEYCNVGKWYWSGTGVDFPHFYTATDSITGKYRFNVILHKDTPDDTLIQCVGQLITPIVYQLTPQTLKTLHGVNNIWSNSNGPISVQYWTH